MNHIVIDLEFDRIDKRFKKGSMPTYFEIIEIGAVKLDDSFRVTERFQSFVLPEMMLKMTDKVKGLTGIRFEDLSQAAVLSDVLAVFEKWAADGGEYDIYAWSPNDEFQIAAETELKKIRNPFSGIEWIDLQAVFDEKLGLEREVSLNNALSWLNIDITGREHRASDDAFNTAAILRVMNNEEEMQTRFEPIRRIFRFEKTGQSTIGEIIGFSIPELCTAFA